MTAHDEYVSPPEDFRMAPASECRRRAQRVIEAAEVTLHGLPDLGTFEQAIEHAKTQAEIGRAWAILADSIELSDTMRGNE